MLAPIIPLHIHEEGSNVRHGCNRHDAFVQVRCERTARERRIAAIAGPDNADTCRVCQALLHQRLHAISDVILHLAAPLPLAENPVLSSVA